MASRGVPLGNITPKDHLELKKTTSRLYGPTKNIKIPYQKQEKINWHPYNILVYCFIRLSKMENIFSRVFKPENLPVQVIFVNVAAILGKADNFFLNTWYLKKLKWYKTVGIAVFFSWNS